uniref:tetranectin n=1 Tax=Pristiophorus japonicus TaxID=55135 RepID=UPI00398E51AF
MKVHRKCFLSMSGQKTFHQAADDCIEHGGVLAAPGDREENDALHEYAVRTVGREHEVWLGITDITAEGSWADVSGVTVNFTNWETEITQQPDGGTRVNCVVMTGLAIGKWFDESCRLRKNYFCQYNIP